jgi:citrate lyase subunit beta/citryl-CoA lyase
MIAKASALAPDEIVIDLEDAVVPERKRDALAAAVSAVDSGAFRTSAVAVRVNAAGTRWAHEELIALAATARPSLSVVVPKVETQGDLAFVDRLLDGAERAAGRESPVRAQALIETARGIANLKEIVAAAGRLESLVIGYADLAVALGRSRAGAARLDGWLAQRSWGSTANGRFSHPTGGDQRGVHAVCGRDRACSVGAPGARQRHRRRRWRAQTRR